MSNHTDALRAAEQRVIDLDRRIKHIFPVGMRSATDLTIELRCGFELFNTHPYHNYETWSNGWYAKCGDRVVAQGETLEELVADLERWAADDVPEHRKWGAPYEAWCKANGFPFPRSGGTGSRSPEAGQ